MSQVLPQTMSCGLISSLLEPYKAGHSEGFCLASKESSGSSNRLARRYPNYTSQWISRYYIPVTMVYRNQVHIMNL